VSARPGGRAGLVLAALATTALALGGCESTQEKSAQLEALAKREKARHPTLTAKGLSIAHQSTKVRVLGASALHSSEGAAAAVTVINDSGQALRAVPIAIAVKGASGRTLYQNNGAGLEPSLTEISTLPAHGSLTWVDDQLPAGEAPAGVTAKLGEAPAGSGAEPRIEVTGAHLAEASTGEAEGTVRNSSSVAQQHLVVYVSARRTGHVVAAGRAVLASVGAGASLPFQVFLVGSPVGAKLVASAPPTTFGH
jgi:hypothetical protein